MAKMSTPLHRNFTSSNLESHKSTKVGIHKKMLTNPWYIITTKNLRELYKLAMEGDWVQ